MSAAPGPTVAGFGPERPLAVIGIGADGWDGLGGAARREIAACEVLLGSARQLALIPEGETGAERVPWPSPLVPALPGLLARYAGRRLGVLASGDPMFFGIGVTLTKLVGAQALRVLPQPSSVSLACARLGWALNETPVVSAVGRRVETVLPELSGGRRLLVLSSDEHTPRSWRNCWRAMVSARPRSRCSSSWADRPNASSMVLPRGGITSPVTPSISLPSSAPPIRTRRA